MQMLPKNQFGEFPQLDRKTIKCKLFVFNNECLTENDLINLVNYPEKKSVDHCVHALGCMVPSPTNPDPFADARNIWNNTSKHLATHYGVCFDYYPDIINPTTLPYIAYNIASFFSPYYQVLYAWHENENSVNQYHIHIVVGATNIFNGNCLPRNDTIKRQFCNYINSLRIGTHRLEVTYGTNYV